jgi:hypothetical protein
MEKNVWRYKRGVGGAESSCSVRVFVLSSVFDMVGGRLRRTIWYKLRFDRMTSSPTNICVPQSVEPSLFPRWAIMLDPAPHVLQVLKHNHDER